jgi:hypothetical protein
MGGDGARLLAPAGSVGKARCQIASLLNPRAHWHRQAARTQKTFAPWPMWSKFRTSGSRGSKAAQRRKSSMPQPHLLSRQAPAREGNCADGSWSKRRPVRDRDGDLCGVPRQRVLVPIQWTSNLRASAPHLSTASRSFAWQFLLTFANRSGPRSAARALLNRPGQASYVTRCAALPIIRYPRLPRAYARPEFGSKTALR